MPNEIDYISSETAEWLVFYRDKSTGDVKLKKNELLWGDQVRIVGYGRNASESKIRARGRTGYIDSSHLGGEALLEVYFIDVGQGDGVLICTPDRKHVLIDGGWPRSGQPTGKNAADFVDWKFKKDYGKDKIELDAILCSHNDQDHYGGLWDLLNPEENHELDIDTSDISVDLFGHAGLSWWKLNGKKTLGRKKDTGNGKMFTDLIDTRTSIKKALKPDANPMLHGEWAKFLKIAVTAKNRNGKPTKFKRLSHYDEYVPGFKDGEGPVSLKILAPVEFDVNSKPAIRYFKGGNSKNTNGNSLLLRVDYGRSRILLTGDLNTRSMQSLLNDWRGDLQEFQCDVAKACHHGSDDVSYEFLSTIRPAVTIISSGDSEGHDHPRPEVVAASATTGYLKIQDDKISTPLIYSTELSRSVKLGKIKSLTLDNNEGETTTDIPLNKAKASYEVTMSGDRNPRTESKNLGNSYIVAGTIYGLVNVRTDGEKILCATMNEKDHTWHVKTINSRF